MFTVGRGTSGLGDVRFESDVLISSSVAVSRLASRFVAVDPALTNNSSFGVDVESQACPNMIIIAKVIQ
jgi:hypothetical protein